MVVFQITDDQNNKTKTKENIKKIQKETSKNVNQSPNLQRGRIVTFQRWGVESKHFWFFFSKPLLFFGVVFFFDQPFLSFWPFLFEDFFFFFTKKKKNMAGQEDEIEFNEDIVLFQGADFEVLGTSCSEQEGRVFVWCATEGVKLYDVQGRRCLLSLPPPKTKLAMVGVDRSHDLGCVFGVTEGNEVCCWDISLDKKENKKSKLRKTAPLEKDTARTVSLLSSPVSPLLFLVSRSGEISAYDPITSKTRRVDSPSQQKIEVLDAKLITTNTTQEGEATIQIFLVFQTSKSQIGVGVVSLLLTNKGKHTRVLSRAHSSLIRAPVKSSSGSSPSASTPNLKEKAPKGGKSSASFSSFTVNHQEEKASVCWSNGYLQLFSYSMDGDSFSLTEQFALHISCFKDQPVATPAPVQSTKRKRKAASVAAVSLPSSSPLFSLQLNPSFLAVFGQTKSRYTLTIWETVHGTLSSSHTISPPPSSSSPLSVSLHNKSDFLAIAFSHTVLVLPVSVPKKSLLSGVIGKASATLPYLAEDSHARFLEAPLSSNVKIGTEICQTLGLFYVLCFMFLFFVVLFFLNLVFHYLSHLIYFNHFLSISLPLDGTGLQQYTKTINEREEQEHRVIEQLTNRSATPTVDEFMHVFTEYAAAILIPG